MNRVIAALRPGGRGWFLLWAGLMVASSVWTFDPKLYINGDNVEYIRLAEAARQGKLWASSKYPPLFPWLLALPQALFGTALIPQKLLVNLLYLASGLLLFRAARRLFGCGWSEPIAWISMTLVPVLEYGHYVMSEIPYLFLSLLALEASARLGRGETRFSILTALTAAATFYTRSVGLCLVVALGASILMRREVSPRARAAFAGASVLFLLPWVVRSVLGPPNPYLRQLIQVNPFYPEWGLLSAGGWVHRIAENSRIYLLGEIPTNLLPALFRWTYDPPELRYHFIPWPIGLAPLVLLGIGLVLSLRRRETIGFYLVLYLVLNILWPKLWTGLRFLVPVLPLAALLLFRGLFHCLGLVGTRFPRRPMVAGVLVGLWLALAVRNQVTLAHEVQHYPPVWESYFKAGAWIRDHTSPDALIVERKSAMLSYVTGRRVIGFPRESDPKRMIDWMARERVDYVLVSDIPYDDIQRYLIPAVTAEQSHFAPAFEVEEPYAVVLRFLR